VSGYAKRPEPSRQTLNMASKVSIDTLKRLDPVSSMSETRLGELAELCYIESVAMNLDPFRARGIAGQSVYLVKGEVALTQADGAVHVLIGGADNARRPLGKQGTTFASAKAVTDIDLIRIDDDLLDIMATWDQLAAVNHKDSGASFQKSDGQPSMANWSILSGMFSVSNLKFGAFAQLPSAHIEELLDRFKRISVREGEVVIREGSEGDYYYVVESGKCRVERMIGGVSMVLAELKSGDAFGEEALVSEAKRNATVTMKTEGMLLRLDKMDFIELLKEPLLQRVSIEDARQKIVNGGQWIDVRYPSEYQYDKFPGALNIPLAEIRNAFGVLDKDREYILYCQSERRSSAAAFLLAQRGYRSFLLQGGLWGGERA
jgi:rhodanese-related sulfurtransferase